MGYFALIKDNVVISVIVAEPSFIEETSLETLQSDAVVDVSDVEQRPGPGYAYDADTETFTAPSEGE